MTAELEYLGGFGNEHASEAIAGTLPIGQNSPQQVAHGLYAEQLSGTSFTAPRHLNRRSWLYRIRPSVLHLNDPRPIDPGLWRTAPDPDGSVPPRQLRWDPLPMPSPEVDWIDGVATAVTNGDVNAHSGGALHHFAATRSMDRRVFLDTDGELLFFPYFGALRLRTELGNLDVPVGHMAIVPRGVKFAVDVVGDEVRGYLCENYGAAFELPEPGPIGVNALAFSRDFEHPVAAYDDTDEPHTLVAKVSGGLFEQELAHSPLDVVAWHGNLAPCRYELRRYCAIGPVVFDHPDPSIWALMTAPSERPGTANIDLILFREQWRVAEHTFRPPWYHRNVMSELMGLIDGVYDARRQGFQPGGLSLHNAFMPHGPSATAYEAASTEDLVPTKPSDSLAVMWESRLRWQPTAWALGLGELQPDYSATVWSDIERGFGGSLVRQPSLPLHKVA